MLIVVDANVICSAMLAKGETINLLYSDELEAIAPELLFNEVEKHKDELLKKSKLSEDEFNKVLLLLKRRVRIIPIEEFKDFLLKANKLLKLHTKDTEYIALAMKYNCPLWSKEKLLKKLKFWTLVKSPN